MVLPMKTEVEYKPKSFLEHYADIKRMFENWGATVLDVTHEYSENDDPGTAFVVTLKGRKSSILERFASQIMTNYAYLIRWKA